MLLGSTIRRPATWLSTSTLHRRSLSIFVKYVYHIGALCSCAITDCNSSVTLHNLSAPFHSSSMVRTDIEQVFTGWWMILSTELVKERCSQGTVAWTGLYLVNVTHVLGVVLR